MVPGIRGPFQGGCIGGVAVDMSCNREIGLGGFQRTGSLFETSKRGELYEQENWK